MRDGRSELHDKSLAGLSAVLPPDFIRCHRSYLVNHEVGHYLGQGHVGCPQPGNKAPVMMQQSIDLGGCVRNAWPRSAD